MLINGTEWRMVPVERSYEMRARAIIAFNTAEQNGMDRDDALEAAYQAEVAAAPTPPAQASGQAAPSDEHLIETGCYQTAIDRHSQPAASAEPSDDVRGEVALRLQERNRHIDIPTARYYVDEVCALLARYGRPAGGAQPVAWVAADTLNSPHPKCISSLAYMSQIDQDRGREYVPLYATPVAAQAPAADADALLGALRKIAAWPDGGNRYGQESIKRFAQSVIDAAMQPTTPQGGSKP